MPNPTTMTYGSYSFSPVPILTLAEPVDKREDDTMLGTSVKATLNGTLTPLPASDGGITEIITLQNALRAAFATDGQHFVIKCGATTLIDVYPRVVDVSFEPTSNNWTLTTTFKIELEWDTTVLADTSGDNIGPYLKSVKDEWTVEFVDDSSRFYWSPNGTADANSVMLRISRNISAVGKHIWQSGGIIKEAWRQAQEWVTGRMGWSAGIGGNAMLGSHGVINLSSGSFNEYNHMRTKSINETAGEFSVSENWLILETGQSGSPGNVTEDFTVTVRRAGLEADNTTVTVEGTIQGLETRSYGTGVGTFAISTYKYNSASGAWSTISGRLYDRASAASSPVRGRTLHLSPLNKTLVHSFSRGSIQYTWEYDDRPCNFIDAALSESITITDVNPVDVFASLPVLGRARGPVLQSIDTVTSPKKGMSIEVIVPPYTGCSSLSGALTAAPVAEVDCVLKSMQDMLTAAYDQVFKSNDTASWNPKTGRYSREVEWTMGLCVGTAPDTTFSC